MKTIEELVAKVAENLGAAPAKPKGRTDKAAVPVKKNEDTERRNIQAIPDGKPADEGSKGTEAPGTYEKMTLSLAKYAAFAAETAAKIMGVNVVTAVCDEGANLVLLHAMDDSYIASVGAAKDKAYTAVALKMPTHTALRESRGGALDGLTNGNGILLLGGGVPLESNNTIYGGIGVSGGTKEQDMLIAAVACEVLRTLREIKRKGGQTVND